MGKGTFIVPDVHGNRELLQGLLEHVGILDVNGERIDRDTTVVQLGDLCNCVVESINDDLSCLEVAEAWLDVYLVGNHEHPYFGGPRFNGFWQDPIIGHKLNLLNSVGLIQPAYAAGEMLLTHAGLTSDVQGNQSAWEWARDLEWLWRSNPRHGLFTSIGRSRGGVDKLGGVLWSDYSEPKIETIPQIIGHTVGDSIRLGRRPFLAIGKSWKPPRYPFEMHRGDVLCLDLGAGKGSSCIAGAWVRDGLIETVIYEK